MLLYASKQFNIHVNIFDDVVKTEIEGEIEKYAHA